MERKIGLQRHGDRWTERHGDKEDHVLHRKEDHGGGQISLANREHIPALETDLIMA